MNGRIRREILLPALAHNARVIHDSLPRGVRMLAVVKADGYGHGAARTAQTALENGADMLAVATVREGQELREAGITAPILVLGAAMRDDAEDGVRCGLIQTVCSPDMVCLCEEAAARCSKQTEVHLKLDTGMGRIGVRTEEETRAVLRELERSPHVRLTGAFTHFSDADGDEGGMAYTRDQFDRFLRLTALLPEGILRHCCNSAAIHRRPDFAMDMVRAGISLYGYPPVQERDLGLRPCMRWTAKISYIKELPAGEFISYGRTFRTERTMRVATVTCGYADGYHRCASGRAEVLIHGKRAKVLGRICMDQLIADVSDIPEAAPEDEVVLIGEDGKEQITAEDIAKWSGTISYEILLSVGSRVERIFRNNSETGEDQP